VFPFGWGDGANEPAPEIIELCNVTVATFGLKLRTAATPKRASYDFGPNMFSGRAQDAYDWLMENREGLVNVCHYEPRPKTYIHFQLFNERDAVLFKTFWL
jgi:hypothetical protein